MQSVSPANTPAVPGYETLHRIGEGGMGEVFLARQSDGPRTVAIKFLTPRPRTSEAQQARRVEREARVVARLEHPNLVTVLEHGSAGGRDYFVMEYVEGTNLRQLLRPGQPLDLRLARGILDGVARALAYLGEQRVVHRDLKPENVLVGRDGVKLTDFGLTAPVEELGLVTGTAEFLGTLDYMAPEQRARLPVDERADQYSFGVMAYEVLTGRRPFGSHKPAALLNPHLGPRVGEALDRALQEDPDDRYPTVVEFAAALDRALVESPRHAARRTASGLLAVALLAVAVAAWLLAAPRAAVRPPGAPPAAPADDGTAEKVAYFLKLGDDHLAAGRGSDAEIAYTEAIRLAPRDPQPLLKRAYLYKRLQLHQKGLDDLAEALRLDPNLVEARTGRGAFYVQLKDYARAIPELDEAVRLDPGAAEALAYRGWARHSLGQTDLARADLDAAVARDRDCGTAYQFRALFFNGRGEFARARDDFRDSIRCDPENPFAHSGLALILATCRDRSLRDGAAAVVAARRACELTRWKDWRQLRILASASAEAGDFKAAADWCAEALRLAPEVSHKTLQAQLDVYRKRVPAAPGGSAP